MKKILLATLLLPLLANAAELTFNFNSPAFNGIGYSSHVLTIKQLEDQATDKNKAAADALAAKAKSDAQNTPTARFLANVESRIFSQLAKQMTDSLFGEGATCSGGNAASPCGRIENVGGENGSTIAWWLVPGTNGDMIHISVTGPQGNTTMVIPANTFFF
jgi:ABC-type oligopeptide transport system substrate-binding subunit